VSPRLREATPDDVPQILLAELDLTEAERAIDALVLSGVISIAVCFLHSYINPDHELQVKHPVRLRL